MEASESGGDSGRPWTASASWAPAGGGAVEDAVSFETSADDAETVPSTVVLERPAPDGDSNAPPCEIISGESMRFTGCMCEAQLGFMKYTIQLTPSIVVRIIYALYVVDMQLKNHCLLLKKVWPGRVLMPQIVKSMSTKPKV